MGRNAVGFLLVASIALVAGCASVPEASPEMDQAAKAFAAPRDKAGVYIYRNETMGAAIKLHVLMDGKYLGETASKTYFYEEVAPGAHYYIWQEIKVGLFQPRNELKQVDEATGRAGVTESKRIATK